MVVAPPICEGPTGAFAPTGAVVVKGYVVVPVVVPLRGVAVFVKAIGLAPPLICELDWADTDGYSGGIPPKDGNVVVNVLGAVGVLLAELWCVTGGHFVVFNALY